MQKRTPVTTKVIGVTHISGHRLEVMNKLFQKAHEKGRVLKVGLEMAPEHPDVKWPNLVKKAQRVYLEPGFFSHSYFSQIRQLAEKYGHKIIWLESPAAYLLGHTQVFTDLERTWNARIKQHVNRFDFDRSDISRRALATKYIRDNALAILRDSYAGVDSDKYATFRSRLMARNIRLHKPDVAIVGAVHAIHLEKLLKVKPAIMARVSEQVLASIAFADTRFKADQKTQRDARKLSR